MSRSEQWSGWGQNVSRILLVLGICLLAMSGGAPARRAPTIPQSTIVLSAQSDTGEFSDESEADTSIPAPTSDSIIDSQEVPAVAAPSSLVPVLAVIDGDTIEVDINGTPERVRFIGIDTPETLDQRKPVQCFGREASAHTHSLLDGKQVRLEADQLVGDRDKYHRLLRYVFVDESLINQILIQDGYAHEYTYQTPYKYQIDFKNAELEAQHAERGLWSPTTCSGDTTKPA